MSDAYANLSGGKLKLKGVKDSKVDKHKKKKKPKTSSLASGDADPASGDGGAEAVDDDFQDRSVVLKQLQDEDAQITKDSHREASLVSNTQPLEAGSGAKSDDEAIRMKTEAERRYEEQRRKRLEDRLKKEGVKTHKQRVEELNRYLSELSEHHDMPKIGPG